MLSAIAARKAAQAVKAAPSPVHQIPAETVQEQKAPLKEIPISATKRKPPSSAASRKKKRKKATDTRYYDLSADTQAPEDGQNSTGNEEIIGARPSLSSNESSEEDDAQTRSRPPRPWSPSQPPLDSSGDELDYGHPARLESAQSTDSGYQSVQTFSFVARPDENVFSLTTTQEKVGTLMILKEGETTAFAGVYSLTVLQGSVLLMGATLSAPSIPHAVFAPKCSPIPILTARQRNTTQNSTANLPDTIRRVLTPEDIVIAVDDLSTGVEGLQKVCRIFDGVFDVDHLGAGFLGLRGARLLTSLPRSLQSYLLPSTWQEALRDCDSADQHLPAVFLIKGQKKTGKSTLARTLLNSLLSHYQRVAFLECDLGQTEFTPPGLVALSIVDKPLFGPPFTHPSLPYASHFIGSTSPRHSPSHYLTSIQALVHTYRIDIQNAVPEDVVVCDDDSRIQDVVPLIVNSMGWTKGLGADLARQIEDIVDPTHVLFVQSSDDVEADTLNTKQQLVKLEPVPAPARYSAADWRTMSIMSYFYSVFEPLQTDLHSRGLEHTWDCRISLSAKAPFAVEPTAAFDKVILAGAGYEDVVPSEVGRVLNGALVALVSESGSVPLRHSSDISMPYVQGAEPPAPSSSNCIGLALIRAVSPALIAPSSNTSVDDSLHLLTPLPIDLIADSSARCLVKGEIELPVWGMLDHRELAAGRIQDRNMPFLQWTRRDAVGGDPRRVRRNLMRKGQM